MYPLRKLYSYRFYFLVNQFSHAGRNRYMTETLGNCKCIDLRRDGNIVSNSDTPDFRHLPTIRQAQNL